MASAYGKNRNIACDTCGLAYDDFRCGITFAQARTDIIAIGFDNKRQKTKYGRRHGVLGFMFELKQMAWKHHVKDCADAAARAEVPF